jgi:hypothetical protein
MGTVGQDYPSMAPAIAEGLPPGLPRSLEDEKERKKRDSLGRLALGPRRTRRGSVASCQIRPLHRYGGVTATPTAKTITDRLDSKYCLLELPVEEKEETLVTIWHI